MAVTFPEELRRDSVLRESLLSFYLETLTRAELADWLKQIDQDSRGSVDELRARIRAASQYVSMPERDFPAQSESYLSVYQTAHLADLCRLLGLSADGKKDALFRRIMREIHFREGWLARPNEFDASSLKADQVMPFLAWMPLKVRGQYEKDFYPIIEDEMSEVFGSVFSQVPLAHGSTLKIDFHIGDPTGSGVGIEVKMPTNNSDVQRALGQIDQYQRRYGDNLILFVLAEFLKPETEKFLQDDLQRKGVRSVFR
jgi:hypothetical protein